jgi:hypothetical protein
MKQLIRWALAGGALLSGWSAAQAQWSDAFDTYAVNSTLPGQGGWEEWDNGPAQTTKVQNTAAGVAVRSAPHSIWVRNNSDTIYDWGKNQPGIYNTGTWTFCGHIYKPTTTTGFTMTIPSWWIMLNKYKHNAAAQGLNWSLQMTFDPLTGNWEILTAAGNFNGPAVFDQWVELRAEIDLNADMVEIFYGGQTTGVSYQWNGGVTGFGTGDTAIDTLDLFADGAANPQSRVYWDDLSLQAGFNGCGGCSSNPVNYCTAGTSASGCQPGLSSTGNASPTAGSGFVVSSTNMEGLKDGTIFFGQNGQQANSWGNGTSFQCVTPPVHRGGTLLGNGTNGVCNQTLSQDLNARWCATCPKPNHAPTPGVKLQVQLWYRDPNNTSNQTTSLTNALEVDVCP